MDVRVICATNADLKQAIAEGRFREDLFFRLNVIELAVPPLAERREDILPLAEGVLQQLSRERGGEPLALAPRRRTALLAHSWPGNVRELFNRIQRAAVVAPQPALTPADLGFGEPPGTAARPAPATPGRGAPSRRSSAATAGACLARRSELGLSRQAFYRKMERLGIILERRPRE